MNRGIIATIALLLSFQVLAISAYSINPPQTDKRLRKGGFGVKIGFVGPSEFDWHQPPKNQIYVDQNGVKIVPTSKFSANFGLGFGVFFEHNLFKNVNLAIAADLSNIDAALLSDNELFLDVSAGPKLAIKLRNEHMVFRPGFAIGLGYLGPMGNLPQPDEQLVNNYPDHVIDRTSYMTLHGSAELFFTSPNAYTYMLEAVLFGTVSGGNAEVSVSTTPTVQLRLGIMY